MLVNLPLTFFEAFDLNEQVEYDLSEDHDGKALRNIRHRAYVANMNFKYIGKRFATDSKSKKGFIILKRVK